MYHSFLTAIDRFKSFIGPFIATIRYTFIGHEQIETIKDLNKKEKNRTVWDIYDTLVIKHYSPNLKLIKNFLTRFNHAKMNRISLQLQVEDLNEMK